MSTSYSGEDKGNHGSFRLRIERVSAGKTVRFHWQHIPQLSASWVMIHGEVLCQVYGPLPLTCLWCSPTFGERSDDQLQPTWPAPGGITERMATERCRSIIVNTTFIGRTCFDDLHDEDSAADIVQSCVTDVQVGLHIPQASKLVSRLHKISG